MNRMRFAERGSVYQECLADEKALVVPIKKEMGCENGLPDITEVLQQSLYQVKREYGCGIVLLPEGSYQIHDTIYIPRAVRLFGFGAKRPLVTLSSHAPGFGKAAGKAAIEDVRYMFWFTSNMPESGAEIRDANPGTFYSALSNIDFEIGEGNEKAAVVRAHFAQNSYVSYCHFELGNGLGGIHEVGNEMEHLSFSGGEWGIYTGKCSPGWPFVLTDCEFTGQRQSGIRCTQSGMTVLRTHFSHMPAAMESMEDAWDKIVMKDCVLEGLERGLLVTEEQNICTQINAGNVLVKQVSSFAVLKRSGKTYGSDARCYLVESFSHGLAKDFGKVRQEAYTECLVRDGQGEESFRYEKEPAMPKQKNWVSVKEYGAAGDGVTDDTEAIRRAVEENGVVYLPQGIYRITDTVILKEQTELIGLHPAGTILLLQDNEEKYAGIGAPKAMLETPRGGRNRIQSIGVDCSGRNPRAVGIKWQSGTESYMYDIKFVGGHGRMSKEKEFLSAYNETRSWDYNPEYDWDSQYWSLWVTNQGGGSFKSIWTASPYAAAGIYISKTALRGVMYQVSSEHHVRQEIVLNKVENWEFYGIQTEEEVAEGSHCQPFELSECRNILFANLYAFRVIWVDNPYDSVIKTWDCGGIEILNFHNFTQMKYTIQNAVRDMHSGCTEGEWQMSRFRMEKAVGKSQDAGATAWEPQLLADHLDAADSICSDGAGTVYLCDSRLKRLYSFSQKSGIMKLLLTSPYRPLTVAADTQGNVLMVVEYRPVKYARRNGVEELAVKDFGERSEEDLGACFYPFFRKDRRIRVISMNPEEGEASICLLDPVPRSSVKLERLYYPVNQWRDNADMKKVIVIPDDFCYVAPDGVTGIVHNPALARAVVLAPVRPGEDFYAVDEYNKYVLKLKVNESMDLTQPEVAVYRGEYSALASRYGELYVTDNGICRYHKGEEQRIDLDERPACLCWLDQEEAVLMVSARTHFYAVRVR